MEPFSITCTTCQAKLKVRSADAIGQIFSCPKCESMVQVTAPPDWQPDAPSDTAATQTPNAAVDAPAKAAEPQSPGTQNPGTESPAANSAEQPPAQTTEPAAPAESGTTAWEDSLADASASRDNLPTGTAAENSPPAPPVELPPLSSDWASPTEALGRKVAVYVVAGGAAILLIGGLIGYLLSGDTPSANLDEGQDSEQQATDLADPTAAEDTSNKVDKEETDQATPDKESVSTEQPPKAETLLPPDAPLSRDPGAETTAQATPEESTDPSNTEQVAAVTNAAANPAEKTSATDPASPADKPLTTESTAETTDVVATADPATLLADDAFDSLLPSEDAAPAAAAPATGRAMSEEELAAAAKAAEDLPAETDDEGLSATGHDPNTPEQAVQRVPLDSRATLLSVEETLALRLPHVKFTNTPLARLLGELSDLSALPIRIDLMALAAANTSPDVPVSIDTDDKTLAEILTELLAPKKLTYTNEGRQISVTTTAATSEPRRVKFSVDDLAADEDKLRELAALIVKSVAPNSWEFADGEGKIQLDEKRLLLEHNVPVVYEAVIFCERLRKSRGLPVRSRLPATQLQLITAQDKAAKILAVPVSCTFHEPTRLIEVLRYLEELSGAKIFVDWQSLTLADFGPMDQITCTLPQHPLGKSLETLLAPLGLDYRVLDSHTIEVFAQADLPNKMTREFYPVQSLLSAGVKMDVLLTGIHQMTGEGAWNEDSTGLIWYDPIGQHLLIRNSNKVHAQIAHLLDELSRKLAVKK